MMHGMPSVILAVFDHPRDGPGLLHAASCLGDLIGGAIITCLNMPTSRY
jgi:hypothetical protein